MTNFDELTSYFECALAEMRRVVGAGDGEGSDDLEVRLIPRDDLAVALPADAIHPVIIRLIDACDLTHLTTITAIDDGEAVQLKYHFWNDHGLTLETALPPDDLRMPTITDIIPGAAFYEREVHGMFGVHFEGHPGLRPLLLPDDWDGGPPLRKESHDD